MSSQIPNDSPTTIDSFDVARKLVADVMDDTADHGARPELAETDLPNIHGYELHGVLGHGGAGTVFRGVRTCSDRPLAIKVLHRRLGDNTATRRAWRELEVLGQLRLQCLPRLLDYGEVDGRMYLVTEFIEGERLDKHCEQRKLNRKDCVELIARVADAVHCLHERGVIHRDLKPSNVVIDAHGQPVVVDLGIAMLLADDVAETLTTEGAPIGSPAYMSPEQARGERSAISTRSDVYGLGATAYMLLTGQPPHDPEASIHAMLHRITHERPRSPQELDPSLPRPLAAVLRKAVSPNPSDRYDSAAAFAEDLRRWLRGDVVMATNPSIVQHFGRRIRRHPILATLAACLMIAVLTVISTYAVVWWLAVQPDRIQPIVTRHEQHRSVSMLARNGMPLHRWDAGQKWVVYARVHHSARPSTGDDVLVLGLGECPAQPELARRLSLFALDELDTPYFSSHIRPPRVQMPEPISNVKSSEFRIQVVEIADVFPDHDGQEIIGLYLNIGYSPTRVCIYDFEGELLFEAWHDGNLDSALWHAPSGILILTGVNSEADVPIEPAAPNGSAAATPRVVFAIRPEYGVRQNQWITPRDQPRSIKPVWYRALLPLDAYKDLYGGEPVTLRAEETINIFNSYFDGSHPDGLQLDLAKHFRISTYADDHIAFLMNIEGELIAVEPSTSYRQRKERLEELSILEFGDLPPLPE